ncbi:unnamed protein product [Blepharisma stoltei]|uniref:Jacalin-type lectin domain-containing protein n=1 Tax=Blepharisma stoltei TaxID=1481888 RepID=A0AAU9IAL0_9CILI|nr:unnamed protein product [Blepharisma stoltei]
MEEEIDIKASVGKYTEDIELHNDLEILATKEHFFTRYKLHKVKCWHIPGVVVVGTELTFINHSTGELLSPGPHIGYALDDTKVTSAELLLDLDEFVIELSGRAKTSIDFIHFRTNKGKYAEFGNPWAVGQFRYKLPRNHAILSLIVGIGQTLQYLSVQPIPIEAAPVEQSISQLSPTSNRSPTIIIKSQYFGVEKSTAIIVDDFFALNLHDHVKNKTSKIIGINLISGAKIYGMEVVYSMNQRIVMSNYNMGNAVNIKKGVRDAFQIEEQDFLVEVIGTKDSKGISSLCFVTQNDKRFYYGKQKGEQFSIHSEGLEIVAIRGVFINTQVLGIMGYFA